MKRIVAGIVIVVAFLAFILGALTFSEQKSSAITLPVPLPTVTVTKLPLPRVTETKFITLPPRPQATKTVTVVRPGPTHTVIRPGPTTTVRAIVTKTPSPVVSTKTVYVTPPPKVVNHDGKVIRVSIPKAVGLSISLIILGIILGLVAVYAAYAVGYKDSEHREVDALKAMKVELFGKRDIE